MRLPARGAVAAGAVIAGTQTVDELSSRIKAAIATAPALRNVAVAGEIQNFKRHSSGHVYFTLMGRESRISAVLFRSYTASVLEWPADGDAVVVTGSVEVYAKGGAYQLYAVRLLPVGVGAQARAKAELSGALAREGLFDARHKRPIPEFPAKVAVVTSPTGAAVRDILKVSHTRAPFVDIVILPALVQGVEAPAQIAGALARAGALPGVSCVILARGGGAQDDLSPFDDERVVRAVRSTPLPVVTGIGHQIDESLADLAADSAHATPSAAAERVFPDSRRLLKILEHNGHAINGAVLNCAARSRRMLERAEARLSSATGSMAATREAELRDSFRRIQNAVNRRLERSFAALDSSAAFLDAVSPLAVLGRGYSICRDARGNVVKRAVALKAGDTVTMEFADGEAVADVTEIHLDR